MADWTQIGSGDGSSVPDLGNLDPSNSYLLVVTSPLDISTDVITLVQNVLGFLGLPISVQLVDSNTLQVQIN